MMLSPLPGLPLRVPKAGTSASSADEDTVEDAHEDAGVPLSHVSPLCGWGSDPHGPVLWKGRYHLFYQGRPGTCQWFWGMRWDHCVSNDLVTWARLPPILLPSPGGLDADGCFTGNIHIHPGTGVPMLFYTGARLRHNSSVSHPDPPLQACHPHMFHWETQLLAVADPDDELLVTWTKVEAPWMEVPHCAWLTSWRDPYFVPPHLDTTTGLPLAKSHKQDTAQQDAKQAGHTAKLETVSSTTWLPSHSSPPPPTGYNTDSDDAGCCDDDEHEHVMIIGSGHEGLGGTALVYRSKDLATGWRFSNYLATWPNSDTGRCWECPHLLYLPDPPHGMSCMAPQPTDPPSQSPENTATATTINSADLLQPGRGTTMNGCEPDRPAQEPAAACCSPVHPPSLSAADEELVRLVEQSWSAAGLTVSQAWAWSDVCAPAADTRQPGHEPVVDGAPHLARSTHDDGVMTVMTAMEVDTGGSAGVGPNDICVAQAGVGPSNLAVALGEPVTEPQEEEEEDVPVITITNVNDNNKTLTGSAMATAAAAPHQSQLLLDVIEETLQGMAEAATLDMASNTARADSTNPEPSPSSCFMSDELPAVVEEDIYSPAAASSSSHDEPDAMSSVTDDDVAADQLMMTTVPGLMMMGVSRTTVGMKPSRSVISATALLSAAADLMMMGVDTPCRSFSANLDNADKAHHYVATHAPTVPGNADSASSGVASTGTDLIKLQIRDPHATVHSMARRSTSVGLALALSRQGSLSALDVVAHQAQIQVQESQLVHALQRCCALRDLAAAATANVAMEHGQLNQTACGSQSSLKDVKMMTSMSRSSSSAVKLAAAVTTTARDSVHHDDDAVSGGPAQDVAAAATATQSFDGGLHRLMMSMNTLPGGGEGVGAQGAASKGDAAGHDDNSVARGTFSAGGGVGTASGCASVSGAAAQKELVHSIMVDRQQHATALLLAEQQHPAVSEAPCETQQQPLFQGAAQEMMTRMASGGGGAAKGVGVMDTAHAAAPATAVDVQHVESSAAGGLTAAGANMVDIKAAGESSMAGFGIVGVLSGHAPHDVPPQQSAAVYLTALQQQAQQPQAILQQQQQFMQEQAALVAAAEAAEAAGKYEEAEGLKKKAAAPAVAPVTPPYFARGSSSPAEIRDACRKYAEAAAALQGHDLGLPSPDAPCVKQCAQGDAGGLPTPAAPGHRWLLGLAPDAATYGCLYFIGSYSASHSRFDLDTCCGPYKLDMGNVLYAPVAYYNRKSGRNIVWGYLKELRRYAPPPALCDKHVSSGCVSIPRCLYLKSGRLFQVPLPELTQLRDVSRKWSAPIGLTLLKDVNSSKHDGGDQSQTASSSDNGVTHCVTVPGHVAGDHMDIELCARPAPGSSSPPVLALHLPSWRKCGQGAAVLLFDWASHSLDVVWGSNDELARLVVSHDSDDVSHDHQAGPSAGCAASAIRRRCYGTLNDSTTFERLPEWQSGLVEVAGQDGTRYRVMIDPHVPPVDDLNPDVPDWIRMKRNVAGGQLWMDQDQQLQLRVFVDASAVEVFTGTGQALSTRVYRGAQPNTMGKHTVASNSNPPPTTTSCHNNPTGDARSDFERGHQESDAGNLPSGLKLFMLSGGCVLDRLQVYTTRPAWLRSCDQPLPPPVTPQAIAVWSKAGFPVGTAGAAAEEEVKGQMTK